MKINQKHLLNLYLYLDYYKKDRTDSYRLMITNISLDKDVLNNIKDNLYITKFDKYNKLQQENKQLKEQIKEYQKALDETMSEKIDIENNWNKLKEYIVKEYYMYLPLEANTKYITILLYKMAELEKGSDSNE